MNWTKTAFRMGVCLATVTMTIGGWLWYSESNRPVSVFKMAVVKAQSGCSNASVNGAYGYGGQGIVTADGTTFSVAEIGRMDFNGSGGLTGVYSLSVAGVRSVKNFTGTYLVGSDCTATATYSGGDGSGTLNFVVANGGASILYSETSAGVTVSGGGYKINP